MMKMKYNFYFSNIIFRTFFTAVFSTKDTLDQLMTEKPYLSETHQEATKCLDAYARIIINSPCKKFFRRKNTK